MTLQKNILVIDDEDSICLAFERFFSDRGWLVRLAASAAEGLSIFMQHQPDVVFLDVRLPDRGGLELLEDLAGKGADVVMITAYGGLDSVVRAIQNKAYDYLVKPLDLDKALALAQRSVDARNARARSPGVSLSREMLVGNSPAMQEAYKLIARAAATNSPVLIQGETGTGKDLAARAIHKFSPRHAGPFVAMNCGAIPENLIESELFGHVRGAFTGAETDRTGRFESADRGTLLLDEVGELPPAAQVKLLRVLDSGVVERVGSNRSLQLDVRVLAATNRDLQEEVRRGRFRQDLFYRLAVLRIVMPPLRNRREDIIPLAEHFLKLHAGEDATPAAMDTDTVSTLQNYNWPGNVRELKNVLDHALTIAPGRSIASADLPRFAAAARTDGESAAQYLQDAVVACLASLAASSEGRHHDLTALVERAMILHALGVCHGNQSEAADYLGLHRNTLRNKLRELGLRDMQE